MSLADELAWTTATELALQIRRRKLSPVEVMDATIERIDRRNPSITAFVFTDWDHARKAAREAEAQVMSGAELGPLHGVPTAIKDLFNFKPGWPATWGGIRALKDYSPHLLVHCSPSGSRPRAPSCRQDQQPGHGIPRGLRQLSVRAVAQPVQHQRTTPAAHRAARAVRWPTACSPSPRPPTAAARSASRQPWCGVYGYKPSFGRVPNVVRPNAFAAINRFIFEGPISRSVDDAAPVAERARRPRPARSDQHRGQGRLPRARRDRSINGWKIGLQPRSRRLSGRSAGRQGGGGGGRARSRRRVRSSRTSSSASSASRRSSAISGAA